jgi:ribosomal protein S18 acetylase RimI-like enzyme
MAAHETAAVGAIVAAAFADKYGPALGDDPRLAAEVAAILPRGGLCYVGERDGTLGGTALLRFHGQPTLGLGELWAIWRCLRARQGRGRALRSLVRLSLLGSEADPDRRTGYLSSLGVLPAYQGQGLGGALLDHLAATSRTAGKARLALHVVDSNAGARRLYERHGFRVVRTEPSFFTQNLWGFQALLYMVRSLE